MMASSKRSEKMSLASEVKKAIGQLRKLATAATRDGMVRYAIPNAKAFGVKVSDIQKVAKQLRRSHALAEGLWQSGWYEARMLAAYVDEPGQVTVAQMDRWCSEFDNWAIVDTICFCLFDRTPHAFSRIKKWSKSGEEFVRRAAYALLWSVSLHDQREDDGPFLECMPLLEQGASDERNFVKKAVAMALRAVGERSVTLHRAAVVLAERLAASTDQPARWVGKDALRKLNSPATKKRMARKP